MKDKIYPVIYESSTGERYLYADTCNYYCLKSNIWRVADEIDKRAALSDKNITHEYLSNTWGVVESKEHAEFIIELAELHGFDVGGYCEHADTYFYFGEDYLGFVHSSELASNRNEKQITIPLPPKKEWTPEVGDEVVIESPHHCSGVSKIKYLSDKFIIFSRGNSEHSELIKNCKLSKPKSKQELLIEELQTKLCNNSAVDNYILACDIINGEIEGLSYGDSN